MWEREGTGAIFLSNISADFKNDSTPVPLVLVKFREKRN